MLNEKNKYLSIAQISKYSNVEEETVRGWIGHGLMGPNNKKTQVLLDEYISFLNTRKVQARETSLQGSFQVLVVEDEINVANLIGDVFTNHGFSVLTTSDAINAGCIINNDRPQIVTLDLGMNTFDGLDVIKIINGLKLHDKVWVVVISGKSEERLQEAVDFGADCYLQKPFLQADLDKIINKFFPVKKAS
jgi:CheY-like chemotaxis protein